MTPERWERINALFASASALPPQERQVFLEREASTDPELGREVQRLLDNLERGGILDQTIPDLHTIVRQAAAADAPRMFEPGDVLANRFAVHKFLGRGGMGEVYAAYDKELRESVALKTIRADIALDDVVVDKFRSEVQRARRIVHRNTCRVYDLFSDSRHGRTVRFLTMELLEGETLDALLARRGRLPLTEVLELMEQIAAGLGAVHSTGLVHRDLKPANVFLVENPGEPTRVVLTDFGLARRVASPHTGESSHSIAAGAGTPAYMAPEQFIGTEVTPATDVYALGLVVYEMVAGARPFPADSATRRLIEPAPPPVVHVHDLPEIWNETIVACLEREPAARPATASSVVAMLRGQEKPPEPSGWGKPRPQPSARPKWPWVAAAVLLAGLIALRFSPKPPAPQSESEQFPAMAPDGKFLVVADGPEGRRDLIRRTLPEGKRVNLTASNPLDDTEPAVSPDGARVVFYSERAAGSEIRRGLHLLDLESRRVSFLVAGGHAPSWSPDGAQVAFVQEPLGDAANRTLHQSRLYVYTFADGSVRQLNVDDALQPAWSPNGRWIAFVRIRGGFRSIDLLDLLSGQTRTLTPDRYSTWSPAWSPDGKFLYFCGDAGGTMNVQRVRIEELTGSAIGDPQVFRLAGDYIGPISIARAKGTLAYVSDLSATTFYRAALDRERWELTRVEKLPVTSSVMLAVELSLSPDGRDVVFSTQRTQRDIFMARLDGSRQQRLTEDPYRDLDPSWSPDGTLIAFQSNLGSTPQRQRYEIHAMRPDGTGRWPLTDTAALSARSAVNPFWHPSGKLLAFTINGVGVFSTRPTVGRTDSAPELLLDLNPAAGDTFIAKSWSSNGKTIAGVRIGGDGKPLGIGLLDVDTRSLSTLTSDGGLGPMWLPDGRWLLYRRADQVWLTDTYTRAGKPLALSEGYHPYSSLAVAPDGRSVVFSHLERKTSVGRINLEDLK